MIQSIKIKDGLKINLVLAPLLAALLGFFLKILGWSGSESITAAVTLLCALWWVTEAVPVPVTSLVPLAVLPMFGVLSPNEVALAYGNPIILLLMGGFMLCVAMESSGTHRQIALRMLHIVGAESPKRLVFAFMGVSAALSMWISNTATALMLLPIALAMINQHQDSHYVSALLLGICYGASVGGIGTPIGTPPNLIFLQVYQQATGQEVGFIQWMRWGLPVVLIFIPVVGFWLTRNLGAVPLGLLPAKEPWSIAQKRVLMIFGLTAIAWITRQEPFGGWSGFLGLSDANDASVVLLTVIIMFLVPNGQGGRLLDWSNCEKIPWGILLLFAGGLCIAKAFMVSGLALKIGDGLTVLSQVPSLVMIMLLCLVVTFMTEVTSNTATTSLLMPILAVSAVSMQLEPALLMVPAAMSASCAFMLPVATAPNAIIYGSQRVPIQTMIQQGFALNLMGVMVIALVIYLSF